MGANLSLLKTRLKNVEKGQLERTLECWTEMDYQCELLNISPVQLLSCVQLSL